MTLCLCDSKNVADGILHEDNLYHFLLCERHKIGNYLRNCIGSLTSSNLRSTFAKMLLTKNVTCYDMLEGTNGPVHNAGLKFSLVPSLNLLQSITALCNDTATLHIEEMAGGIGLFTLLLGEYISQLYKDADYKITLKTTDGKYELGTRLSELINMVDKKDIADYIADPNFERNGCYIVIDPINYKFVPANMLQNIESLLLQKKPKLCIIMKHNFTEELSVENEYKLYKFFPNVIHKFDNLDAIEGEETNVTGYLCVRKDIYVAPHILGMFVQSNMKSISNNARYIVNELVRLKLVPDVMKNLSDSKLIEILGVFERLHCDALPLYLKDGNEIDTYLMLLQTAYSNYGLLLVTTKLDISL